MNLLVKLGIGIFGIVLAIGLRILGLLLIIFGISFIIQNPITFENVWTPLWQLFLGIIIFSYKAKIKF